MKRKPKARSRKGARKSTEKRTTKGTPSQAGSSTPRRLERDGFHLPVRNESEQFEGLATDLLEAWQALRAFALDLGRQEAPHTSHRSIMLGRRLCYLFVRPKKSCVEVTFFLPRAIESPLLKKVTPTGVTRKRFGHVLALVHVDQVDAPLTDWVREAYGAAE